LLRDGDDGRGSVEQDGLEHRVGEERCEVRRCDDGAVGELAQVGGDAVADEGDEEWAWDDSAGVCAADGRTPTSPERSIGIPARHESRAVDRRS
jgi:hypothetical protein